MVAGEANPLHHSDRAAWGGHISTLSTLSRMALSSWACLEGGFQGGHSWEWVDLGPVAKRTEAGPGNTLESHKTEFTLPSPS